MDNAFAHNRAILVCAFANTVHGLDRASGLTKWTATPFGDSSQGVEVEMAIVDGVVIVATNQNIAFIDYATGHVHAAVGIPEGLELRPTMIVDGSHVYVARAASVTCFTLRGQVVWNRRIPSDDQSSMALGIPGNVRQADDTGR